MHLSGFTKTAPKMLVLLSYGSSLYQWLSGKLWYFQHNCVGDTIVSLSDIDIYCIYVNRCEYNLQIHANKFCYIIMETDMILYIIPQRAKFMGSTWGPSGADMLAPWTLLSRTVIPKVEHGSNVKLTTDIPYFDFQCKLQGVYWIFLKKYDIIKWKHFPRYWLFVKGIHQSMVDLPPKGQWHGVLLFSLIYAWINGWANNRDARDLRCHHTHCDVTVMRPCYRGTITSLPDETLRLVRWNF